MSHQTVRVCRLGEECLLLIDPLVSSVVSVVRDLLISEPEGDLSLGRLDRVGTVDEVASNVDGKVATDGARGGISGVGGTDQLASVDDGVLSFPDHRDDSSRREVLAESGEEGARLEVIVVLGGKLGGGDENLDSDQLEALRLEASNQLTYQTTLDRIRLESDESALVLGSGETSQGHLLLGGRNGQEAQESAVND